MNIWKLTISYIKQNKLGTFLNVLLLGLGMATIVVLLLFSKQLDDNIQSNIKGVDLVVGAKGSPLQLILSSVFHIDTPPGNIPVTEARELSSHPMVAQIIPLALGDSYEQFRIVGSTPELITHYEATIEQGNGWNNTYEVVIGAQVAEEAGVGIGDEIISAHGIGGGTAHGDHPLEVVGVLGAKGTVVDRLVLTSIETVWAVHGSHAEDDHDHEEGGEHGDGHDEEDGEDHAHEEGHDHEDGDDHAHEEGHDHEDGDDHAHEEEEDHEHQETTATPVEDLEYTSLIVKYSNPVAGAMLPRYINKETNMQAAAPVFQTARLLSLLGTGIDAFRMFAYVLIIAASLGVFIALYNAMKERAYDLAIMRTMGASRRFLLNQVILEGVLLALLGTLLGFLIGHGAAELLGVFVGEKQGITLSGLSFASEELWLLVLALVIGVVASVLPAIQAYRTDIASTLSQS